MVLATNHASLIVCLIPYLIWPSSNVVLIILVIILQHIIMRMRLLTLARKQNIGLWVTLLQLTILDKTILLSGSIPSHSSEFRKSQYSRSQVGKYQNNIGKWKKNKCTKSFAKVFKIIPEHYSVIQLLRHSTKHGDSWAQQDKTWTGLVDSKCFQTWKHIHVS